MPETKQSGCAFDPNQCPLLQGLSPDEQQYQMQSNPMIRACAAGVEAGGKIPARCRTPRQGRGSRITESGAPSVN